MLVFEERGKPEYPEKNLSEQGREPTTNSTHIWRRVRESNPGHIGKQRIAISSQNDMHFYDGKAGGNMQEGLYVFHRSKCVIRIGIC